MTSSQLEPSASTPLQNYNDHHSSKTKSQIIKLRRLLHCMKESCTRFSRHVTSTTQRPTIENNENTANTNKNINETNIDTNDYYTTYIQPSSLSNKMRFRNQTVMDQIKIANEILDGIKSSNSNNDEFLSVIQQLEHSVYETCEYVTAEQQKMNNATSFDMKEQEVDHNNIIIHNRRHQSCEESDLMYEIFFKEDDHDDDNEETELRSFTSDENLSQNKYSDNDDNDDVSLSSNNKDKSSPSTTNNSKPLNKHLTKEELQKRQEELLQQEISDMASQLKQSTMNINSTLVSQNIDLDNVETLAQNNLDKTKNVKDEVTDHVKATGWRKNVGRWIVFFVILGTWVFCFLTIRVVPRRKNACLFFCDKDNRDSTVNNKNKKNHKHQKQRRKQYDDDYYYDDNDNEDSSYSYSTTNKNTKFDSTDETKHIDPKYSYCENAGQNNKQCTRPSDFSYHSDQIYNNDVMKQKHSEEYMQEIITVKKEQRRIHNLNKAKEEDEGIGRKRIKDNWASSSNKKDHIAYDEKNKEDLNENFHQGEDFDAVRNDDDDDYYDDDYYDDFNEDEGEVYDDDDD